ncbi:hypothetical protein ISCGN_001400 [Ixodes scapularis]
MSSVRAVSTATDSRGITAERRDEAAYRIILPTLPTGVYALNSAFLHADVGARPYRIEDFKDGLEHAGVLGDIAACGSYQMNHVWMVTLKSPTAKQRLVDAQAFEVKGRRCLVIDPDKAEVRLKLHWIPFYIPDDNVKKALEQYGKVEEIARETWRVNGFEGVQSTTRAVRLTLKDGVTTEQPPHQLRLSGCTALVIAPGRAPLCLRCRRTGHIRKECRVPRCEGCRRYGHTRQECMKTYADVVNAAMEDEKADLLMDQAEAEEAAGGTPWNLESQGRANTTADAPTPLPATPSAAEPPTTEVDTAGPPVDESAGRLPSQEPERGDQDTRPTSEASKEDDQHDSADAMEALEGSSKRPLEQRPTQDDGQLTTLQGRMHERWQAVMAKRGRYRALSRTPTDDQAPKEGQ